MDPDEVLNIKGFQEFARVAREELKAEGVTDWTAKLAIQNREVKPTRLGNANWFCRRDVKEWLESRKQTGHYRASKPGESVAS